MIGGITVEFNQDEYRKKVDNFLTHAFIEFFQNPPEDVMLQIYKFLAELFDPYVPEDYSREETPTDEEGPVDEVNSDRSNTSLKSSVRVTADGITYDTEYAHYVYEGEIYGPNFLVENENGDLVWRSRKGQPKTPTGRYMTYQNPLSTRHWDETAIANNRELVEKTVRNIIIEAWKNEYGNR